MIFYASFTDAKELLNMKMFQNQRFQEAKPHGFTFCRLVMGLIFTKIFSISKNLRVPPTLEETTYCWSWTPTYACNLNDKQDNL